jgi:hypothetical protein
VLGLAVLVVNLFNFTVDPAGQHQPNHFVVADKRPEGILKRGGFVFLDKEMAKPRGAIAGDQCEREQPPSADRAEENDATERDGSADQMQHTGSWAAMFGDVVWPKLGERMVLTLWHLTMECGAPAPLYNSKNRTGGEAIAADKSGAKPPHSKNQALENSFIN